MPSDSFAVKRRYPRIHGPFEAWRPDPVRTHGRVIDLNLGGCFVTAFAPRGLPDTFELAIDLGAEGVIDVQATAIYHRPHGSAVRFADLTSDACEKIERTVAADANKLSVPDDGAITRRL